MKYSRRRILRLCGVGTAGALAGCTDGFWTGEPPSDDQPTTTPTPAPEADGVATRTARLSAGDGDTQDYFGESVAVSSDGTTAVVGAFMDEDPNGDEAGAAYVFDGSGGSWRQRTKLLPEDGDERDVFGCSVAISSDGRTAVVGASNEEDPNGPNGGAAYVFDGSGGSWTQQAKLSAEDGDDGDTFGESVALSGDGTTAVVGAPVDETPNGLFAGSAYVFDGSGGSWSQQAKLLPDDGNVNDGFGVAVAVSSDGTTAILGARFEEVPNGENSGAVYVFETTESGWRQRSKLTAEDGDNGDWFGESVALSGDGTTALVGARFDEEPSGEFGGSAYVFDGAGGAWNQQAKLAPDDGDSNDQFGYSVAVSADGTTAFVGATGEEDPNGFSSGSVYLFRATDTSWTEAGEIVPDDGELGGNFGRSVTTAAGGTTALVGAVGEPGGEFVGATYVYEL